ncbi:NADH-quinone oxidoreductase subunit C [archaeon]|nr:NADH-quinone oxidoreductase subunit C [archaeon]
MILEKLSHKLSSVVDTWHADQASFTAVAYTRPDRLRDAIRLLLEEEGRVFAVWGIDRGYEGFEVVYLVEVPSDSRSYIVQLRVQVPRSEPTLPSITDIEPSVAWLERETQELLGISFSGNPVTRNLFLPSKWPELEP